MPRLDLKDKPIAITGASSGIGAASAFAAAAAGMPVALFARREDKLQHVANRITTQGGRAIVVPGSVDNQQDCQALIERAESEFGPLYAVFANAGYGQESPTLDMSDHDLRQMFETNFFGSLNTLRPAIERFKHHGHGHAIMCSSCLSKVGLPSYAAYSASKACQDHFGRAMRHELKHLNIHVSTVHPIGTKTEFFETASTKSQNGAGLLSTKDRFLQPPSKVARALIKQLHNDRAGEIWTSLPARLAFASLDAFPRLTDAALHVYYNKRKRQSD